MSEYSKKWDADAKVGVMTRTMTRDVKDSVKEKINKLYADKEGNITEDYRKGCAEWHWNVVAYFNDEDIIDTYTGILELFYRKKIDPNNNEKWKRLMRRTFPQQFIKKMSGLKTQVPIIAIMDDTVYEKTEELEWWED